MDKKERKEFLKKKKEFLKKVEDEPNNASNYSILGEIFEHLTKKGAACKNYKRSLELKYDILSKKKLGYSIIFFIMEKLNFYF